MYIAGQWPRFYAEHPNKEAPFPELSPCPWCGRESYKHDLTKHVDPSIGTHVQRADTAKN